MTSAPYEGFVPEFSMGDRLRKAREHTGMTTREFADHIGVSQKTINNAEADKHGVRKIVLNAWSLATGVSVEWLKDGTVSGGPGGGGNSQSEGWEFESLRARNDRILTVIAA